RSKLCEHIGQYWRHPQVIDLQPHNLLGHAFRSLIATALELFGNNQITYTEEISPYKLFPGQVFPTRSKKPLIDIVAHRDKLTVAILSCRWRIRHDRVDVVDEAVAYAAAAHRYNPHCEVY